MSRRHYFVPIHSSLWFLQHLTTSSTIVLNLWQGVWYTCFICGWALLSHIFSEPSSVVNFCIDHHPFHKETSVMISEGRTEVQIDMNLETSLILCPYSKIMPESCEFSNLGFLPRFRVPHMHFLCKQDLNSISTWLMKLIIVVPLFLPWGISFHTGHLYTSQGSQLGRTIDKTFYQTNCKGLVSWELLVPWELASGKSSLVNTTLISSCPVMNVCDVFVILGFSYILHLK